MGSSTQLSLKWLRDAGYDAEVVEQWRGGCRHDLFGIADIVAVRESEPGMLLVQTTTAGNVSSHVHKILGLVLFRVLKKLLLAKNRLEIHGWGLKNRKPGDARKVWRVRILSVRLASQTEHEDGVLVYGRRGSGSSNAGSNLFVVEDQGWK